MNRFVGRPCCFLTLSAAVLLASTHDALAQLDEGYVVGHRSDKGDDASGHFLVADGGSSSDSGNRLGNITVPARPADAQSYVEYWTVPKSLAGLHDNTIQIEPRKSDDATSTAAEGPEKAHHLNVRSDELDIDETMLRNNKVESLVADAHASSDDALGGVDREVWELLPNDKGAPSWQRTAVVYASANGTSVTETWLLFPSYVYPSHANGVTMEVRFIQHDASIDTVSFTDQAVSKWRPTRLIVVHAEDLGVAIEIESSGALAVGIGPDTLPQDASAGCSVGTTGAPTLWWLTGALGAALATTRRQQRRRQA